MFTYRHADGYSEAIPFDELAKIAHTLGSECRTHAEAEVRACAERVVREEIDRIKKISGAGDLRSGG